MSRKYARGAKALGECQRCGAKVAYDALVFDGEMPNLRVCLGCWDPRHPQEFLQALDDPIALWRPAPENLNAPTAPILTGEATLGPEPDPFLASVVALLHFDGVNNSTTITDFRGHAWTANGTATLTTSSPLFGTASLNDPTGQSYVSTPASTDFGFGTGDFTIEFVMKPTTLTGSAQIIYDQRTASSQARPVIYTLAGADLRYNVSGVDRITAGGVLAINTQYHVAVSRVNGTTRLFLNGTLLGSFSDGTTYDASTPVIVGNAGDNLAGSAGFIGLIDELRITKGVGRYTTAAVPPLTAFSEATTRSDTALLNWTESISDVSQISSYELFRDGALYATKTITRDMFGAITNLAACLTHTDANLNLLTNGYSYYVRANAVQGGSSLSNVVTIGPIDQAEALTSLLIQAETALTVRTGSATIAVIGDGAISSAQTKFGTSSFQNPGTSSFGTDYIRAQSPAGYFIFPGALTWDGWFYPTAFTNTFTNVYSNDINFPNSGFVQVAFISDGKVLWNSRPGDSIVWGNAGAVQLNRWQHIAIVRDDTNKLRCFVDGIEIAQTSGNVTDGIIPGALGGNFLGSSNFTIGRGQAGDNGDFQGFLDEIRVVNGVAAWTSNFTPPTEPYLPQI